MSVIEAAQHLERLMTWGGGFEQRSRQIKSVYATVQSRCPDQAPMPADCLYYGWHSSTLEQAVYWRLDILGTMQELIWSPVEFPARIHHTFLQAAPEVAEDESNSPDEAWAAALTWFLLPPSLGENWLFLLEQASEGDPGSPGQFMPDLSRDDLKVLRGDLRSDLRSRGYRQLLYRLDSGALSENAYYLLPDCLTDVGLDTFRAFYEETLGHTHVQVTRAESEDATMSWDVRIEPGSAFTEWLAWSEKSLAYPGRPDDLGPSNLERLCEQIAAYGCFDDMVAGFEAGALGEYAPKLTSAAASEVWREAASASMKRVQCMPKAVKEQALRMAKESAVLLMRYRALVQWRWDDLRGYLSFLAVVAQDAPLRLSVYDSVRAVPRRPGQLDDLVAAAATDVALEFSEGFRRVFTERAPRSGRGGKPGRLHRGVAHHYAGLLLHPGSVARGLLFDPEGRFLSKGGAVVVDPSTITR